MNFLILMMINQSSQRIAQVIILFIHQDLQKLLFGEIAFDNDFRKIRKNTG